MLEFLKYKDEIYLGIDEHSFRHIDMKMSLKKAVEDLFLGVMVVANPFHTIFIMSPKIGALYVFKKENIYLLQTPQLSGVFTFDMKKNE